jgi:hypothetical protein
MPKSRHKEAEDVRSVEATEEGCKAENVAREVAISKHHHQMELVVFLCERKQGGRNLALSLLSEQTCYAIRQKIFESQFRTLRSGKPAIKRNAKHVLDQ